MISPGSIPLILVVGGVGAVASFAAYSLVHDLGSELEVEDYLPMPPPNPPLPRFMVEKRELVDAALRRESSAEGVFRPRA